jgi:uncharacterized protein (TIGR02391 family)
VDIDDLRPFVFQALKEKPETQIMEVISRAEELATKAGYYKDAQEYSYDFAHMHKMPPEDRDKLQEIVSQLATNGVISWGINALNPGPPFFKLTSEGRTMIDSGNCGSPNSNLKFDQMGLHPKIREVSGSLFKSGLYSQAILEAYKMIVLMVKEKTGREDLDGQNLMAQAFNEASPLLSLNDLATPSDKDEQTGFKFIYMGATRGIRNPKAHDIIQQTDPTRTLEYLALASLLARRIDESKK